MPSINYVGNPDGLSEDLGRFLFLHQTDVEDFSSLTPRVIVGRKGSGKSFTLRKFATAAQAQRKKIYVLPQEFEAPDLQSMISFSAKMGSTRTNRWQAIWEMACLLSIASHFRYSDDFIQRFSQLIDDNMFERICNYVPFFNELEYELPVYQIVEIIIHKYDDFDELHDYLNSSHYRNFTSLMQKVLEKSPTISIYLDCLDDELRRAPSIIIDITRALFYRSIKWSRQLTPFRKIHLHTTIRDIVYSTIMASEHGPRYRDIPQVTQLRWTPQITARFLNMKFERGMKDWQKLGARTESAPNAATSFLGFEKIENISKGLEESVVNYIVRHTNCSVRTNVSLCNRIFAHWSENGEITPSQFRTVVNNISEEEASTLIKISSAYIVSSIQGGDVHYLLQGQTQLDKYLKDHSSFSDLTIARVAKNADVSLTDGFVRPIMDLVNFIGVDVFSRDTLLSALSDFENNAKDYSESSDKGQFGRIENVFWAMGLIGARRIKDGKSFDEFFFFGRDHREARLPTDVDQYVFFPGLNSLCNLKISKGQPVGASYYLGARY